MKKPITYVLTVLLILIVTVFIWLVYSQRNILYTVPIKIGGRDLFVQIADTPELRSRGLSGRKELPQGKGMLFVFPKSEVVTFWMKDMNFPIDIIFIRNRRVVRIEHGVPNFPAGTRLGDLPRYSSVEPVEMVLEVPAGWAKANGVETGSVLGM